MLQVSQYVAILFPMTGEQKAVVVLWSKIAFTKNSAFALAGLRGFIFGITEVTPSAGLKRENTGSVTRSISPL